MMVNFIIVNKMRNYAILQLILLLCEIISYAQNTDCNRAVWIKEDEKKLPKEICIPNGNYHITEVYEKVDVNGDGLEDFIFDWNKNPLQDGDTIYVTIYTQNSDSTFSFFRTFNNLYPIYFRSYDLDYVPEDTSLISIHKKYEGEYQLKSLKFKNDFIIIEIFYAALENLIIKYKYNNEKKNWVYYSCELYSFLNESKTLMDLSGKLGPTIDNFTYFYWLEE